MKNYLDLVRHVLKNGTVREDRTGVGTIATFGNQVTFDLRDGFPATTTKRLAFKAVVSELLGFIKGADNLKDFGDAGAKIWQANYEADYWVPRVPGDLGRIYGTRYRKWRKSTFREQPKPTLREGLKATVCGVGAGRPKSSGGKNGKGTCPVPTLYYVWRGMLRRCYEITNKDYIYYGGRGVYVCNEWLEFAQFEKDAASLPGWDTVTGHVGLELDKDKREGANGYCYSKTTCQWLTHKANLPPQREQFECQMLKDGQIYTFRNINKFAQEQGLAQSNLAGVLNAKLGKKSIKGFTLVSKKPLQDDRYIDQLQELINSLKDNPNSRRHVVTMWNPAEDTETVLPPCHYAFQCFVDRGALDMVVIMRSLDLFLGFAFDIASYAILQTMLAREVGLVARSLTFQVADTHIYLNHVEQVKEMLRRKPKKAPTLFIEPNKSFFELSESDFSLLNYDPHPTIKADMAV